VHRVGAVDVGPQLDVEACRSPVLGAEVEVGTGDEGGADDGARVDPLGVAAAQVRVAPKSAEGLGFTGRGEGITALAARGIRAAELRIHLGPAICGDCYEVGPEVHAALGLSEPAEPCPVDLRAVILQRALELGLSQDRLSSSEHCTRCGGSPFFSHRAGDPERHGAAQL
jgi:hypothetical protein